jgi:hypothetical protein
MGDNPPKTVTQPTFSAGINIYYSEYSTKMDSERALVMFVIVAAFGLVAVAAVEVALISQLQDADARGCRPGGTGSNASKGRCIQP